MKRATFLLFPLTTRKNRKIYWWLEHLYWIWGRFFVELWKTVHQYGFILLVGSDIFHSIGCEQLYLTPFVKGPLKFNSEECQWFVQQKWKLANLWPSSDKCWHLSELKGRFALAEPLALPEVEFLGTIWLGWSVFARDWLLRFKKERISNEIRSRTSRFQIGYRYSDVPWWWMFGYKSCDWSAVADVFCFT